MRSWPEPPFLIAASTRAFGTSPISSRLGPVTPRASTAASVWQLAARLEELLSAFLLALELALLEPPHPALGLVAVRDHHGRDHQAEHDVEDRDSHPEGRAALGEIRLARGPRPTREGDEDHRDPDQDEGEQDEDYIHGGAD